MVMVYIYTNPCKIFDVERREEKAMETLARQGSKAAVKRERWNGAGRYK